ncbi:T9SS type A sorting domain-containing protein [Thalassobellus sediminis]|uniref:T9SS type A sorting domain-containing protein n=1 Tax=Thalassobellus sediminis TaxID=3367753 RepID=UPI0037966B00
MKTNIIFFIIFLFGFGLLKAQSAVVASGGEAIGVGGTASYSIGQICYEMIVDGTGNTVAAGVQQPYEIFEELGVDTNISIDIALFPNPTSNYLTLRIDKTYFYANEQESLKLELLDINGRLIRREIIQENVVTLNLESLEQATYFFNLIKGNQLIKAFKVVKN